MNLKKFSISLRGELLSLITGIEDVGFNLYWDNTTPNYITKRKLKDVYEKHLQDAALLGLFIVTRHSGCPYPSHDQAGEHGYVTSNNYNLSIPYRDPNYIWGGDQMYQGSINCRCPCSPKKEPVSHWIIEDVIFSKNVDLDDVKKIYLVLSDVYAAIQQSGDKQPRSGIRENLLRAILQLNDIILPVSVEDHIKKLAFSAK